MQIGNNDNAIRHLTEAIKSSPEDTLVLYNLALAHANKKDFNIALTIINKCLTVDPNYSEAKSLKQQILIMLKD
jgi:tetratricopeptide (TPR) repeat protein